MSNYKLTIITINFNNLEGLKRTVESVINQSLQGFEYIIIDGGSTDGSALYIEEMKRHFDYWVSEPDRGIYHAMNKGIEVARGEYLLFLNSGDVLINSKILNEIKLDLCDYDLIQYNLQLDSGEFLIFPQNVSLQFLLQSSLGHQSLFSARRLFLNHGLFEINYKIASDWVWYFNLFVKNLVSYKYFSTTLSVFETNGISNTNKFLSKNERRSFLEENYPLFIEDLKLIQKNKRALHYLRNHNLVKLLTKLGLINKNILIDYIY